MTELLAQPWLTPLFLGLLILLGFPLLTGYLVLVERKVLADMQVRLGPMRVGPHGLLQPLADALKLVLKEIIVPRRSDRVLFWLAPGLAVCTGLSTLALLPFSRWLHVADVNIALLLVTGLGAFGLLSLMLGGWASNSSYSLLGALRSAAQLISYEVALSLALLCGVMRAGSLSLVQIVEAQQQQAVWFVFGNYGLLFLAFFVYFVAATAETSRAPFDLPEAESELVAGYHTEYSGFHFAFYMLAEYANIFAVLSVAVTVFWGGWLRPFPNVALLSVPVEAGGPLLLFGLSAYECLRLARRNTYAPHRLGLLGFAGLLLLSGLLFLLPAARDVLSGPFWFLLKVSVLFYILIWFRATFPRLRYDQLMDLGWKRLIPLGLALVFLNAVVGMI